MKVRYITDQQVPTDRTICNQKPDLIIRGNEKGTCMLIDVENSGNGNLIKREVQTNRRGV